ncbi:hypothetical protein JW948_04650 [bacterium]|nr:hypothetical protein [bacterium]
MKRFSIILFLGFGILSASFLQAQMEGLKGDVREHKSGLHAGNQFRTTFYNDGTYGQITYPPDIGGEWPINTGALYLIDGNVFVGSEVIDEDGVRTAIVSENESCNIQYSRGDQGPRGEWWTFLPLPGFTNPNHDKAAMSKWPWSWPAAWPDKFDDSDSGWRNDAVDKDPSMAAWNGYFGKNVFNADEESFFMADDYANQEFNFYPDTTDTTRGGLGIRMTVRGFQWANTLVEDAIFILFDLENIGTYNHNKVVFGYKIGNDLGNHLSLPGQGDTGDDNGQFDREQDVSWMWDNNGTGVGGWGPVGYFGAAFLESPGNAVDGIDNDGDGADGPGDIITTDMFASRVLNVGDPIVKIDYTDFSREVMQMTNESFTFRYNDRTYTFAPGDTIRELPHNLVDDNLNGIIDESNGAVIGEGEDQITTYLYTGLKSINYFTNEGLMNPMIEERRDDGIDNDGDWDPENNDLGADGAKAASSSLRDPGEGDGIPTLGEANFDKTDISETDMLGLTSFNLYVWETIPLYDDDAVWDNLRPGFFNDLLQNANVELFYGSGYFPMHVGQTQRFSMGLLCGEDFDDFFENKYWVSRAYDENYNFSKSPRIPVVKAVAGDGVVTLFWDSAAEDTNDVNNIDPVTGFDFEGYRIYRSTDPGFNDLKDITDGKGNSSSARWPIAQFDIVNEYEGYAKTPVKGVQFWLGENLGLVHSYRDTTVINGFTYYYAVTSYDHGSDSLNIAPTECTRFIAVNQDGTIETAPNVTYAQPEAPVAGFQEARSGLVTVQEGSTTDGSVSVEVMYPDSIRDGHQYRVTFKDSLLGTSRIRYPSTVSFTLEDVTTGQKLIEDSPDFLEGAELPETHGFRIHFHDVYTELALNEDLTGWSRTGLWPLFVRPYANNQADLDLQVGDFAIIFGEVGIDTCVAFPERADAEESIPVNFTIWNMTLNRKQPFALRERDVASEEERGMFTGFTEGRRTRRDEIIILTDSLVGGWEVSFSSSSVDTNNALPGDTAFVYTNKPFLSNDVFEFVMHGSTVDEAEAKVSLEDIRVVPNPYVVANSWEPQHNYSSGRGDRHLHFINLPEKCEIKIFNVRGQLIAELEHDAGRPNGTVIWNMQTKDNLDIAYGVYIYYVDAGKIGTHIGKFAVIK